MRGKETKSLDAKSGYRITPAYAGKRQLGEETIVNEDHPRVCGEKLTIINYINIWVGSPPRMRGKGLIKHFSCLEIRITPAYAGKSHMHSWFNPCAKDHPRVCGEKP